MDFTNGEYESRIEILLRDINGESLPYDIPLSRIEQDLQKKLGEDYDLAPIMSRIEAMIAYILKTKDTYPKYPMSRIEKILRKYIGNDVEVEPPQSRVEELLLEILDEKVVEELISGTSPIYLPAVSKGIISLIQHGKVEQNGTPTPSAPAEIKCNNGALRMVHRSGLPSGYKLLEYVGGSGSQYVITDLYLASTDVVECEYCNSSSSGYGAVYGVFALGESSALYGNQTYYGYNESNNKVDTDIHVNTEWHTSRHDFVNGTLTIDDTTVTFTPFEFVNSVKNAVLSRYYNRNYGYNWKGYVRKFKVTRNGEVVCDLLPAKDSNDVAGLYDLVTGAFYTAAEGTLLEGDVVDDYEFVVDGTPEVLNVTASGATPQIASIADLLAVGDYEDTQEIISGAVTRKCGVKVFDGTEAYTVSGGTFRTVALTDKAVNTKVLCSHFNGDVEPSSSVSTMPDLSVKGYGPSEAVFFKHSAITTVADWKAWLADQYAQGTPVIVLYPLAEEVAESVAPQPITASGNTTITANSQYINDIELESKYYKKVES